MDKTQKIVIKLAYDRYLLLDVTQENMKLALQLMEHPLFDNEWREGGTVYVPKKHDDEISIKVERVVIASE